MIIKLKTPVSGEREFPKEQALNIMRIPKSNRGGWEFVNESDAALLEDGEKDSEGGSEEDESEDETEVKKSNNGSNGNNKNSKGGKSRKPRTNSKSKAARK